MQLGMIGLGRMGANMVRRLTREGHECVPQGHVESRLNLGSWVNTQRGFYKADKLEAARVARLVPATAVSLSMWSSAPDPLAVVPSSVVQQDIVTAVAAL